MMAVLNYQIKSKLYILKEIINKINQKILQSSQHPQKLEAKNDELREMYLKLYLSILIALTLFGINNQAASFTELSYTTTIFT